MMKESQMKWNWGTRTVEAHKDEGCWEFRLSQCCGSPHEVLVETTCMTCKEASGFECEICETVEASS